MERHPSQNLLSHLNPRYMSPLPGFPARPLWKGVPISRAFFYTSRLHLQSTRKERRSIFGALLPLILTVPCKRTPFTGSPMGPLRRHPSTEPSISHPPKIHLSLTVPGEGAPSMFPKRVPMDRGIASPEPLVCLFIHSFIHVCLPESPKRTPPTNGEKH
jgi:hypothetical protein